MAVKALKDRRGISLYSLFNNDSEYQKFAAWRRKSKAITKDDMAPIISKVPGFVDLMDEMQAELDKRSDVSLDAAIGKLASGNEGNFKKILDELAAMRRDIDYLITITKQR